MSDLQEFYEKGLTVEGKKAADHWKKKKDILAQAKIGASDGADLPMPAAFVTTAPAFATTAAAQATWSAMSQAQQKAWLTAHGLSVPFTSAAPLQAPVSSTLANLSTLQKVSFGLGLASTPFLVYHGYKRNNSIGWALLWGMGSIFWPVFDTIALAQGYGKPRKK